MLEYFSPCISAMIECREQLASNNDHEIESVKSHWSEVTQPRALVEKDDEEMNEQKLEPFVKLSNDPQWTHLEQRNFLRPAIDKLSAQH